MAVNGRQKGSAYERVIAKPFAEWSHSDVKRVPLSGGWAKEAKFDVKNDLVSTDRYFPVGVECKKREGWVLENILANPKCPIFSWWKQVRKECVKWRLPVLVFTKNRYENFVMVRVKEYKKFKGMDLSDVRHMIFTSEKTGTVFIMKLDDFLAHLPYKDARKVAKRNKKLQSE